MARRGRAAEAATEPGLVGLAYDLDLPLVATNDVHFPERGDVRGARRADLHRRRRLRRPAGAAAPADARALLQDARTRWRALFADLPEAIENTVEIARRCAFRPRKRKPILPRFAEDEVEELRAAGPRRARRRGWRSIPHAAPRRSTPTRLEFELGVIEEMGFPGYFLIVADFIKWAKEQRHPGGTGARLGRGQSLVAYALTITDLDPLRYGLLFERFLNPERISMPDFDIDFCMDRREEVIAYVQEQLRPRPGGADHHLRRAALEGGGARRRAGCCRCPTARSTGSRS